MKDLNNAPMNGGYAFPYETERISWNESASGHVTGKDFHPGMTLLDYFAAKAMQAILQTLKEGIRPEDIPTMARDCYGIAAAMLKAREVK